MDPTKYMIIAKGKFCTRNVISYYRNTTAYKFEITFNNGSRYSYSMNSVIFMSNPILLDPKNYRVSTSDGRELYDIRGIYQFEHARIKYWHVELNGFELDYRKDELSIIENCLTEPKSTNVFDYLKSVSALSEIPNDNGEILLQKYYEKIEFIPENSALSLYLNPDKSMDVHVGNNYVFPFGCNQSQYRAVINALDNQISVIQGPPGTGKTQTILNIIANLLINNKSVLVVSSNNSATANVLEKLSKEEYGMDFLVASLGSVENKNKFIENQSGIYPDLSLWKSDDETSIEDISEIAQQLQTKYLLQEKEAILKEKKYEIELEFKHFKEYYDEKSVITKPLKTIKKLSPGKIMQLWQRIQDKVDHDEEISPLFRLVCFFCYGITDRDFFKQNISDIIIVLQKMYYEEYLKELSHKLKELEEKMTTKNDTLERTMVEKSLEYVKGHISKKYKWNKSRGKFTIEDLYKNSKEVLKEYPIILSTTFSARTSLNADAIQYDYVIMDEASQVDIATGALALSCAGNAVVVGDLKQLPNVISQDVRQKADLIRNRYHIDDAYDFANNSFLQSLVNVIPDVPSTLLREHYRCHPRIISFCNQKFYDGELIIMTKDDDNDDALMAVKTVEGNHARDNYNQRQIDVIKEEILPDLQIPPENIGIIAPYNNQVNEIKKQIPGIEVATVHKFQGREKDIIILSTVDNQIKDFTDDPYLLNVAVSRAKKRLIVVVSGNKQENNGNITDLISYIQYNKMEVIDSQIYSVFDYLYAQYREQRWKMLKVRKRISEYDSENLTYMMLTDILEDHPEYGVQCFEPLSMIARDMSELTDEEVLYASNPATHIDFMIYNKYSKQPVVAIETDGYMYHKKGTAQYYRDIKKDHILEKIGLKMVRLNTNGSNEKTKVLQALGLD